jgi:hypothetical protein
MRLSPGGTTELLSDSMCAKEFGEFFGEAHTFVVLGLVEDIVSHPIALREANRKRGVALLPGEVL